MLRNFFLPLLFFITLFGAWYHFSSQPFNSSSSEQIEFIVKPGESLDKIIDNLYKKKLIRSRVAAKINITVRGLSKKIQAGYFYFSPSKNLSMIVLGLTHSSTKQIWVTLPEGLRREEIAYLIYQAFDKENPQSNFSSQEFLRLTAKLEGHLFPDTYAFHLNASTKEVVERLSQEFQKKMTLLNISPDKKDIIILASLLERESQKPEEMPLIAGIIIKRIESGWPLQIDASVQYAVSSNDCSQLDCNWWPSPLTSTNLEINSPYNTYINQGLPPTPICNPGYHSLEAANSYKKSDYWFYLHDSDGKIHFASTKKEHQYNICRYLKKNC